MCGGLNAGLQLAPGWRYSICSGVRFHVHRRRWGVLKYIWLGQIIYGLRLHARFLKGNPKRLCLFRVPGMNLITKVLSILSAFWGWS